MNISSDQKAQDKAHIGRFFTERQQNAHDIAHGRKHKHYPPTMPRRLDVEAYKIPEKGAKRNRAEFERIAYDLAIKLLHRAMDIYTSGYDPCYWHGVGYILRTGFSEAQLRAEVEAYVKALLLQHYGHTLVRVFVKQHPTRDSHVLYLSIKTIK